MLSICITVKNRSRVVTDDRRELTLFPKCVDSIARAAQDLPCELVVSDWHSDDWPLSQWLDDAASSVPVRVVSIDGTFARGIGRNLAADAARGDHLFFLDADCLVSRVLLTRGIELLNAGQAFFPVCYSYSNPEHTSGWWRHEGLGTCFVTRDVFQRAGRWPEYAQWGKEDDHFHDRVRAITSVVREEVKGYFHQWHPEDIDWKDRYADVPADVRDERKQVKLAIDELASIIPPRETFLLVDEARFGIESIDDRRAVPFLEQNNEYAGPPEDDATAIAEFARMHERGVRFIAFAWPAFWWLDYYKAFEAHVAEHMRPVFENDRLKVFTWKDRR